MFQVSIIRNKSTERIVKNLCSVITAESRDDYSEYDVETEKYIINYKFFTDEKDAAKYLKDQWKD